MQTVMKYNELPKSASMKSLMQNKLKGYWRVQSLDKLRKEIEKGSKNAVGIKKRIERYASIKPPDCIKVEKCDNSKTIFSYSKSKPSKSSCKMTNVFFTQSRNKEKDRQENIDKELIKKRLLSRIFSAYDNEEDVYNSLPFLLLNTDKFKPRKFEEVLEDSRRFNHFNETMNLRNNNMIKGIIGDIHTISPKKETYFGRDMTRDCPQIAIRSKKISRYYEKIEKYKKEKEEFMKNNESCIQIRNSSSIKNKILSEKLKKTHISMSTKGFPKIIHQRNYSQNKISISDDFELKGYQHDKGLPDRKNSKTRDIIIIKRKLE